MTPAFRATFAAILRTGLGLLFLVAGAEKILDPAGFAFAVARYGILPEAMIPLVALCLPWLEVFAAVALIPRSWRSAGQVWIATMMVAFVTAVVIGLLKGLEGDCGCLAGMTLSWPSAGLKALLLIGAIWLVHEGRRDRH